MQDKFILFIDTKIQNMHLQIVRVHIFHVDKM